MTQQNQQITTAVAWPEKCESEQLGSSVKTLLPYKVGGSYVFAGRETHWSNWVFDDPSANLKAEAFVGGASQMIDKLVEKYRTIKQPNGQIVLLFSHEQFTGATELRKVDTSEEVKTKMESELQVINRFPLLARVFGYEFDEHPFSGGSIGTTYYCEEFGLEAWLCPALFCYFKEAPARLYARTT